MSLISKLLEDVLPVPFVTEGEWKLADHAIANPSLYESLPKLQVRTEHIQPTQGVVDNKKIDGCVKDGKFDGGFAVRRFGKVFLLDGHHRWCAAKKVNKPTVWLHLLKLPDGPSEDVMRDALQGIK